MKSLTFKPFPVKYVGWEWGGLAIILHKGSTANFANWSSASSPDQSFPRTNLLTKSFSSSQTDKASASQKAAKAFLERNFPVGRWWKSRRAKRSKWVTFFQFISHKPLLTPTQCDISHNIEIYKKVSVIQWIGVKILMFQCYVQNNVWPVLVSVEHTLASSLVNKCNKICTFLLVF